MVVGIDININSFEYSIESLVTKSSLKNEFYRFDYVQLLLDRLGLIMHKKRELGNMKPKLILGHQQCPDTNDSNKNMIEKIKLMETEIYQLLVFMFKDKDYIKITKDNKNKKLNNIIYMILNMYKQNIDYEIESVFEILKIYVNKNFSKANRLNKVNEIIRLVLFNKTYKKEVKKEYKLLLIKILTNKDEKVIRKLYRNKGNKFLLKFVLCMLLKKKEKNGIASIVYMIERIIKYKARLPNIQSKNIDHNDINQNINKNNIECCFDSQILAFIVTKKENYNKKKDFKLIIRYMKMNKILENVHRVKFVMNRLKKYMNSKHLVYKLLKYIIYYFNKSSVSEKDEQIENIYEYIIREIMIITRDEKGIKNIFRQIVVLNLIRYMIVNIKQDIKKYSAMIEMLMMKAIEINNAITINSNRSNELIRYQVLSVMNIILKKGIIDYIKLVENDILQKNNNYYEIVEVTIEKIIRYVNNKGNGLIKEYDTEKYKLLSYEIYKLKRNIEILSPKYIGNNSVINPVSKECSIVDIIRDIKYNNNYMKLMRTLLFKVKNENSKEIKNIIHSLMEYFENDLQVMEQIVNNKIVINVISKNRDTIDLVLKKVDLDILNEETIQYIMFDLISSTEHFFENIVVNKPTLMELLSVKRKNKIRSRLINIIYNYLNINIKDVDKGNCNNKIVINLYIVLVALTNKTYKEYRDKFNYKVLEREVIKILNTNEINFCTKTILLNRIIPINKFIKIYNRNKQNRIYSNLMKHLIIHNKLNNNNGKIILFFIKHKKYRCAMMDKIIDIIKNKSVDYKCSEVAMNKFYRIITKNVARLSSNNTDSYYNKSIVVYAYLFKNYKLENDCIIDSDRIIDIINTKNITYVVEFLYVNNRFMPQNQKIIDTIAGYYIKCQNRRGSDILMIKEYIKRVMENVHEELKQQLYIKLMLELVSKSNKIVQDYAGNCMSNNNTTVIEYMITSNINNKLISKDKCFLIRLILSNDKKGKINYYNDLLMNCIDQLFDIASNINNQISIIRKLLVGRGIASFLLLSKEKNYELIKNINDKFPNKHINLLLLLIGNDYESDRIKVMIVSLSLQLLTDTTKNDTNTENVNQYNKKIEDYANFVKGIVDKDNSLNKLIEYVILNNGLSAEYWYRIIKFAIKNNVQNINYNEVLCLIIKNISSANDQSKNTEYVFRMINLLLMINSTNSLTVSVNYLDLMNIIVMFEPLLKNFYKTAKVIIKIIRHKIEIVNRQMAMYLIKFAISMLLLVLESRSVESVDVVEELVDLVYKLYLILRFKYTYKINLQINMEISQIINIYSTQKYKSLYTLTKLLVLKSN